MQMPGFTAEASMYRSKNLYQSSAAAGLLRDSGTGVVPQDCGWASGILCGTLIGVGAAACTAFCFSGPGPCAACWLAYLGGVYQFCHDCIPAWMRALVDEFESGGGSGGGGGGGGGGGCCPPGKRCCGNCAKVSGRLMCDDVCVGRRQACP